MDVTYHPFQGCGHSRKPDHPHWTPYPCDLAMPLSSGRPLSASIRFLAEDDADYYYYYYLLPYPRLPELPSLFHDGFMLLPALPPLLIMPQLTSLLV